MKNVLKVQSITCINFPETLTHICLPVTGLNWSFQQSGSQRVFLPGTWWSWNKVGWLWRMKKIIYMHTVEYHLAKRKKVIQLSVQITWMEPVGGWCYETSQPWQRHNCVSLVCGIQKVGPLGKTESMVISRRCGVGSQVDGGTGKMFKGCKFATGKYVLEI